KPGAAVTYDTESKTIDFYADPATLGNDRSTKLMVPTDGGAPRKASGETPYAEATQPGKSEDCKKIVGDGMKGDTARKDSFGLTMSKAESAPVTMKDGQITKETALKNPDGTWTIIDDKTPLGGLTAEDMKKDQAPAAEVDYKGTAHKTDHRT